MVVVLMVVVVVVLVTVDVVAVEVAAFPGVAALVTFAVCVVVELLVAFGTCMMGLLSYRVTSTDNVLALTSNLSRWYCHVRFGSWKSKFTVPMSCALIQLAISSAAP